MRVESVYESDKPAFWQMLQAYIAELAPYAGLAPGDGDFPYDKFDLYWTEAERFPFWAREGDARAGFALVWNDRGVHRMAEFYVVPQFRRNGFGAAFARDLIMRFPGAWKIRQIAANAPAVAFWRKALLPFGYTEERFIDRGIDRVEQSFVVRQSTGW